jgi:hypothetical protein
MGISAPSSGKITIFIGTSRQTTRPVIDCNKGMVICKVQEDMVDEITSSMPPFNVPPKNRGDIPHEESIRHRSREEPMSPKRDTVLVPCSYA